MQSSTSRPSYLPALVRVGPILVATIMTILSSGCAAQTPAPSPPPPGYAQGNPLLSIEMTQSGDKVKITDAHGTRTYLYMPTCEPPKRLVWTGAGLSCQ